MQQLYRLMPFDALLAPLASGNTLDSASVRSHLSGIGLDTAIAVAERAITHKSDRFVRAEAQAGDVEAGWRHALALHETQIGLPMALRAAEQAWGADPSEATWGRIVELQDRMAQRSDVEDPGAA
jgi:DNA primase